MPRVKAKKPKSKIQRKRLPRRSKEALRHLDIFEEELNSYRPEYVDLVKIFAASGDTEVELCDAFQVRPRVLYRWCIMHPEFGQAFKAGTALATGRVEKAVFDMAVGFQRYVEKVLPDGKTVRILQQMLPNLSACKMWLLNRDPENWKERRVDGDEGKVTVLHLDPEKLKRIPAKELEKVETVLKVLSGASIDAVPTEDEKPKIPYTRTLQ